jgi:hypothetical protein
VVEGWWLATGFAGREVSVTEHAPSPRVVRTGQPGRQHAVGASGGRRLPKLGTRSLRLLWLAVLATLMLVFAAGVPDSYDLLRRGMIGVLLETDRAGQIVLTPIPGQPAAAAGVRAGDLLRAIDGEPVTAGIERADLSARLRGAAGAPVTITVARPNGDVADLTFRRAHAAAERLGMTPDAYARTLVAIGILFVIGYAVPAAIIALRQPGNWVAASVWLTLILIAMVNSRANAAVRFDSPVGLAVSAGYHLAVLLVLLTFPDGRLVPRWTRWYLPVGVAWIAIKLAPLPAAMAMRASPAWILIDFLVFGIAISAQFSRLRSAADPAARQQTKWLVYGFVAAFLVQYAYHIPVEFVSAFRGRSLFEFVGSIVNHLLMLIVPVAFTHAVLRYRLYDIDLIINRTLVYVPLTGILAGVFTASVTVFRSLILALTGETSDVATVLSTVLIVALLTPVKDRLQKAVDARFRFSSRAERQLKDFELQVGARLQAVQAGPVIRRLLEHAVQGLDAMGGAAELIDDGQTRPLCTVGEWSGEGAVNVPVRTGERSYGRITLGAPRGRASYGAADLERLRSTAAVVAAAIEEDRRLEPQVLPPTRVP